MTSSSTFASRVSTGKPSAQENLFIKIEALEQNLELLRTDLHRLDQQAKSIQQQKSSVEVYLEQRAQMTRDRLMTQLKKFEQEVRDKIDNAKRQTHKLDQKINAIKANQLTSLQLILSMQRRVKQIEVQLGSQ